VLAFLHHEAGDGDDAGIDAVHRQILVQHSGIIQRRRRNWR
jgi:hypothetical protein